MRSGQCMELVTGGSDMWIFIVFICVTVTAIIIFVNYRRTKKTMDTKGKNQSGRSKPDFRGYPFGIKSGDQRLGLRYNPMP